MMEEAAEILTYAFADRSIQITALTGLWWNATIKINDRSFLGRGYSPSEAIDRLCGEIVRYKDSHPEFIIARHDV